MATLTLPGLAEAYHDNPYEVAGFADVPTLDPADILRVMANIKSWAVADGARLTRSHSAQLLFGLLHVARTSYATCGKGDYWPHLNIAVRGDIKPSEQSRVRCMFRDTLNEFGYPSIGHGDCLVRDVTYHCGVPDKSLAGLVDYVDHILSDYGDIAIDIDARELAKHIPDQFPGLHSGVRLLLQSGQRGVETLWSAVASAVLALRQGETPEEAAGLARLPCGVSGVALCEALHALQSAGPSRAVRSNPVARPPRLRYEFDSGSVRVWMPKGDWALAGAEVAWNVTAHARTACLLKPPAGTVTATGPGRDRTWHLRRDGFPGILFHAGSGHLLDADELAGLDPGPCVLAWPGTASPQVGAVPLELREWSYLASPGWSAWRVEVPAWHKDRPYWEIGGARLPLARRPRPAVCLPDPVAWADDDRTGERLRVYASPPTLKAGRDDFAAAFVHRRATGLAVTRGSVSAHRLGSKTDLPGAGLYRVLKTTGCGVAVARYAVITDLAVAPPAYDNADGVSVLVRGNPFCGHWTGANVEGVAEPVGWRFHGGTDRPALEAAFAFDAPAEGTLHFAWPVKGLRWRVVVGGVEGEWGRTAVRVSPADARRPDCVLQVQADSDVLVNGAPVKDGRYRDREGGVLVEVGLEGYAHAETLTVTANGQTLRAAVFHDRPTLTRLTLTSDGHRVEVAWSSPLPGEIHELLAWNPLDPASPARAFVVGKGGSRELSWADLVSKGATWPVVCVAMASVSRAGFRASPVYQLAGRDNDPTRALVATVHRTPGGTPVNPVLLAVATYVTTRVRMHEPPDAAEALALAEAAGSPRSLPPAAWREFLGRLPAVWPAFRNRLAAWGTPPPPPPAAFVVVDEYAARLDQLSGAQPKASERQRLVDAVAWLSDFHTAAGLPPINDLCPLAQGQGELPTRPGGPVRWALWTVPRGQSPMLGLTATPLDIEAWAPGPVIDHFRLTWRREDFALTVHPLAGDRPFPLPAGWPRVPRHDLVRLCERWAVVRRIRECWADSPAPSLPPAVAVVEAALRPRLGPGAVVSFVAEQTKARPVEVKLAGRALVITAPPDLSQAAHDAWRLAFAARAGRRLGNSPDFMDALLAAGPVERVAGLLALAEMLCVALFTDGLGFAARWTPVVAHSSPPVATVSRR